MINIFSFPFWDLIYSIKYQKGGTKMEDKKIVCKDCGKEFIFTVGEQQFYQEKGFTNEPVRCKECRDKRKSERNNKTNAQ